MTVVAIHQPQYLPWVPYLDKADQADVFVYLDNVRYDPRGVQNRNQIKTPQGAMWLTVPVAGGRDQLIGDLVIAEAGWQPKHVRSIALNYAKAPHVAQFGDGLRPILQRSWTRLAELNIAVTEWMFEMMGIRCKRFRASELSVAGEKEDRIISICKAVGGTAYLSGAGAAAYQSEESFRANGLELRYQQYAAGEYSQCWPKAGFVPGLSALDLILNAGADARKIMLEGRQ